MAKKKNTLGKLLAFTTTVAAIGGTCYIFRDKIKASHLYQRAADTLSSLKDNISGRFCDDDDFFFDADDDFEDDFEDIFEDAEPGREYTSITINAKDNNTTTANTDDSNKSVETEVSDTEKTDNNTVAAEESPAITSEEVIPIINFNSSLDSTNVATEENSKKNASDAEVSGYENEGLSDVSEDPDILEDQDKLDF